MPQGGDITCRTGHHGPTRPPPPTCPGTANIPCRAGHDGRPTRPPRHHVPRQQTSRPERDITAALLALPRHHVPMRRTHRAERDMAAEPLVHSATMFRSTGHTERHATQRDMTAVSPRRHHVPGRRTFRAERDITATPLALPRRHVPKRRTHRASGTWWLNHSSTPPPCSGGPPISSETRASPSVSNLVHLAALSHRQTDPNGTSRQAHSHLPAATTPRTPTHPDDRPTQSGHDGGPTRPPPPPRPKGANILSRAGHDGDPTRTSAPPRPEAANIPCRAGHVGGTIRFRHHVARGLTAASLGSWALQEGDAFYVVGAGEGVEGSEVGEVVAGGLVEA